MSYGSTPGVTQLKGDADANRKRAAERSEEPQEPGSEFTQTVPQDLQTDIDRLDALREELGALYGKLYSSSAHGGVWDGGYSGPPYTQRQAIQAEINDLCEEEGQIQARMREYEWILPNTVSK